MMLSHTSDSIRKATPQEQVFQQEQVFAHNKLEIQSDHQADNTSSIKCTRQCSNSEDDSSTKHDCDKDKNMNEVDDGEFESFSLTSQKTGKSCSDSAQVSDSSSDEENDTNSKQVSREMGRSKSDSGEIAPAQQLSGQPITDLFDLNMGMLLSNMQQQQHHQHQHQHQHHKPGHQQSSQQRARAMSLISRQQAPVALFHQSAALAAAAAQFHAQKARGPLAGVGCAGGVRRLSSSASPRTGLTDTPHPPPTSLVKPPRFPKLPSERSLGDESSRRSSAPSSLGDRSWSAPDMYRNQPKENM